MFTEQKLNDVNQHVGFVSMCFIVISYKNIKRTKLYFFIYGIFSKFNTTPWTTKSSFCFIITQSSSFLILIPIYKKLHSINTECMKRHKRDIRNQTYRR